MELNRFELQTVVVFLLVVRTNLIKSLLSYYWQRCPWYTLVFLVMHSLQHLKQRLTLKCILLMLATESLICRCLCSFFFFLFCVYLLLSCWLSEKRDGCALVSRSERTGDGDSTCLIHALHRWRTPASGKVREENHLVEGKKNQTCTIAQSAAFQQCWWKQSVSAGVYISNVCLYVLTLDDIEMEPADL